MGDIEAYTKAYATKHQIGAEEAEKHKMVQLVKEYYEEVESIVVKTVPPERKCDS